MNVSKNSDRFVKSENKPPRSRIVPQISGSIVVFSLSLSAHLPLANAQSVTSSPQLKPIPAAPSATRPGPFATTAAEYRFPATIDPDIIGDRETEIWAVVHRPKELANRPNPLIVFLHGNHATCGTGSNPRIDDNVEYTFTGTCPAGYVVVPNHRGYDYLAKQLASWGYVVVSINANRGINAAFGTGDDFGLNLVRGRLILKHLQLLSKWNNTGGTPTSLGVDLQGKLSFNDVGLMGHSRGGEGVRAAYNLYRDAGSPWPNLIPNKVTFKGMFEIAPVDGQAGRLLDADGLPWNVLLPECDGDVSNMQGMPPFDRMLRIFTEKPATFKSTYTVWGANHNYYNTEWQTSDSDFCANHEPIFTPGLSVGSAPQRATGSASLLAFMRGNIPGSVGFNPIFNRHFNPQFGLPREVTQITRVDRGYTSSPNKEITAVLEDFDRPTGTSSLGFANLARNINISHGFVPEHDFSFQAGNISWSRPGDDVYFQTNAAKVGQGINITAYKTLDLRVENQFYSAVPTDLQVSLVLGNGSLSRAVSLKNYVNLKGPVGGPGGTHAMLKTARISLNDFGVSLTDVQGVRLTFNKTQRGAIYVGNMRLSTISERGDGGYFLAAEPPTPSTRFRSMAQRQTTTITDGNKIVSIRRVGAGGTFRSLGDASVVEIEIASNQPFPVRNELQVLRIGDREFLRGRYPKNGDTNRLIFTLSDREFGQVSSGEEVSVQYGRGVSNLRWTFGRLNK
jgi:hypothetical protein